MSQDPEQDPLRRALGMIFDHEGWDQRKRADAMRKIEANLAEPVRLIGVGQTGVGKTELLRSIFNINDGDVEVLRKLRTDSTRSETKGFFSFTINSNGYKIQFTDGPGLGEDRRRDPKYLADWIAEIPKHDLLYWVMDSSSRDVSHIQENMKAILDRTGFRDRFVLILNKVDKIELEGDDLAAGHAGWNLDYNMPTRKLEAQIRRRTDDVIEKFKDYCDLDKSYIVVCSALRRWNHDKVLDAMLDCLPKEKRLKASLNKDVKSATDLMAPEIKARVLKDAEKK